MVGRVATPNGIEVALHYVANTLSAYNIIALNAGHSPTQTDLQTVANTVDGWARGPIGLQNSNQAKLVGLKVSSLEGAGSPTLDFTTPLPQPVGKRASAPLSPQVTICVSLYTGLGGRSYRGRLYVCFPGVDQVNVQGQLNSGIAQAYLSCYNDLKSQLASAGYVWSVLSQYSGYAANGHKQPRPQGILTPISSLAIRPRADTQRRRLPKEL